MRSTVAVVVAATIGFLAPFASAADCVKQAGCEECESRYQVLVPLQSSLARYDNSLLFISDTFANNFCQNYAKAQFKTWGWASAVSTGKWASKDQCITAFTNIIEQCYGNKDGGSYNFNDSHMTVYFCNCESA
ncbi:hypothetical protein AMATHDRAFT_5240 [Amanita thiersii Skay4041]|uniref:Uncharacterized protein n=1 Tax=Amanita thiersii Skay4041 TaxID=703135 RepID=A0A2A9NI84_9AGAR|nr:hypothetical protein AMATHDRAFT_5240 [Amanita thiersii Skay4041]